VTRERILDAAEALFAEHGYEGTSLRDVAGAVGLRNPSLYNHFESKDTLYTEVLERGIGPVVQALVGFVERGREGAEAAPEILATTMHVFDARPAIPRLVQHEVLSGGQRLTPMLKAYLGPAFEVGCRMAAPRAQEAGWEDGDVPYIVIAMIQIVLGFFSMAPLLKELNGQDLLTEQSLARQTRFLIELADRLFTSTETHR
jgi:AcrR family transcriptional regulator